MQCGMRFKWSFPCIDFIVLLMDFLEIVFPVYLQNVGSFDR